jgi:DNA-binding HxlR family transcriptional regulator
MRAYRVSTIFTQRELLEFLDHNLNINVTIEVMPEEQGVAVERRPQDTDPIYTPERVRTKRKSKVTESIINRLKELGSGDVSQLRHALTVAGLSESSLSTGLAVLQKSGQIKRDRDSGNYHLVVKEAAE